MRESAGGLKVLGMVMVFFFIFIMLLAVSINYAQAFRVKNKIIDYIEQYEGYNLLAPGDGTNEYGYAKDKIEDYIDSIGYFTFEDGNSTVSAAKTGNYKVCRKEVTRNQIEGKGRIYRIVTYVTLHLPGIIPNLEIPITGETKFISKNGIDYSDLSMNEGILECE